MPSLKTLLVYNSELEYDCNAMWMKQENMTEKAYTDYRSVVFRGDLLKGGLPPNRKGSLLRDLPISALIPLFKINYNLSIGEELHLEGYAMG